MEQSFRCSTHEAALSKAALLKTSAHALVFFSHGSCYRIFFFPMAQTHLLLKFVPQGRLIITLLA